MPNRVSASNFRNTKPKSSAAISRNFRHNQQIPHYLTRASVLVLRCEFRASQVQLELNRKLSRFHKSEDRRYYDRLTLIYTDASKNTNVTGSRWPLRQNLPSSFVHQHLHSRNLCDSHGIPIYSRSREHICTLKMSDSFSAPFSLHDQHPKIKLAQLTNEVIFSSKIKTVLRGSPSHVGIPRREKIKRWRVKRWNVQPRK